jgi:hypothetical protein
MYVQILIQLYCTKKSRAILMSYHPETKSAHYFSVMYDSNLVSIIVTCLKSISSKRVLTEADRWDCSQKSYDGLWSSNFNIVPDFTSLSALRRILTDKVKVLTPSKNVQKFFD